LLFPGRVGSTFGSAANFRSLLHDMQTKLFGRLPDGTWFYPGTVRTRRWVPSVRTLTSGAARGWSSPSPRTQRCSPYVQTGRACFVGQVTGNMASI
jgi:hypothetical protein